MDFNYILCYHFQNWVWSSKTVKQQPSSFSKDMPEKEEAGELQMSTVYPSIKLKAKAMQ